MSSEKQSANVQHDFCGELDCTECNANYIIVDEAVISSDEEKEDDDGASLSIPEGWHGLKQCNDSPHSPSTLPPHYNYF